jgi:hypothetical protein
MRSFSTEAREEKADGKQQKHSTIIFSQTIMSDATRSWLNTVLKSK